MLYIFTSFDFLNLFDAISIKDSSCIYLFYWSTAVMDERTQEVPELDRQTRRT